MADYGFEFFKWDKDLEFLVGCLSETLREIGEEELARVVPWLSGHSRPVRLDPRSVRVYSLAFQLLNTVEENTANQARRREDGKERKGREAGRWRDVLPSLLAHFSEDELRGLFEQVSIVPTLTAHPTEAKRATVLGHYRDLYLLQVRLENQMYSSSERALIREEIKAHLERIFRTGEVFIHRPDVFSELRNVAHYLADVFPPVVSLMVKRFLLAWKQQGRSVDTLLDKPIFPGLGFGNWVGGDRDGHPFVTAQVTKTTLTTLRQHALDLQREQIRKLAASLSLDGGSLELPDEFHQRMRDIRAELGSLSEGAIARNVGEPFRQFLNLVAEKIPRGASDSEGFFYQRSSELVEDLAVVSRALQAVGAGRLAQEDVLPAIQIAHTFGFHLARLDIRQNSGVLERAFAQIVDCSGALSQNWSDVSVEERREFIQEELGQDRPLVTSTQLVGVDADEIRNVFKVIAEHTRSYGGEGIGSFIVSMTRSVEDLLLVLLLAREGGCREPYGRGVARPLHVVPLFETIEDLQNSEEIIRDFLSRSVPTNDAGVVPTPQEVMIGYSDSNKDGGILASFWALQCAQERLVSLSHERGRPIRFFHGRGGTISRGAGPTDRFLASLPAGALAYGMKLTEQGETISQKYANLLTASYNLEVLLAGALRHSALPAKRQVSPELSRSIQAIAASSSSLYRKLLSTEGFVKFFRMVTPVDVIEQSKIGSRPSRRTGASSLDDLRAIPWVFAWNQSRFLLSGWYGVGGALEELRKTDSAGWGALCQAVHTNAELSYVFLNIETSLHSAHQEIMELYAKLCSDSRIREYFMGEVLIEFTLSKSLVSELLGGAFSERRPRMFKTLSLREPPLADLHRYQVELLREWRTGGAPTLLDNLLLVTNAIAAGLRTTG